MKGIIFALLLILLLANCSCSDNSTSPNKDPVADFTYSGTEKFSPCAVIFTNTSQNAVSYNWDFGDNGTSTETSPTHNYLTQGVYTVKLTAKAADGKQNITSKTINIKPAATKMKIVSLKIITLPPLAPDGTNWDLTNGPDVAYEIYQSYSSGISSYFSDVLIPNDLPLKWDLNYTIDNLNVSYIIFLYDVDVLDNDLMANCNFSKPMDYILKTPPNNYPSTIQAINGQTKIEIGVTWE